MTIHKCESHGIPGSVFLVDPHDPWAFLWLPKRLMPHLLFTHGKQIQRGTGTKQQTPYNHPADLFPTQKIVGISTHPKHG